MSRRGRGEIPHPPQGDWRAVIHIGAPWDRAVLWILRRLDSRKGLYAAQMARELVMRKNTCCALLRSAWPAWARHVLGLNRLIDGSTGENSGTAENATDPRAGRALAAIRAPIREPIGNRSKPTPPPTRRAKIS